MITLTREEAQQVLDALEDVTDGAEEPHKTKEAIETLRARLNAPEPEPVAWMDAPERIYLQVCDDENCDLSFEAHDDVSWCQDKINDCDILYVRSDTAPPKRKPKPEPVAWGIANTRPTEKQPLMMVMLDEPEYSHLVVPLYTAPPQREWVGLTDEEYEAMAEQHVTHCYFDTLKYAKAIAQALKEKNNG